MLTVPAQGIIVATGRAAATALSTYCLRAAWEGDDGSPGSVRPPVIATEPSRLTSSVLTKLLAALKLLFTSTALAAVPFVNEYV